MLTINSLAVILLGAANLAAAAPSTPAITGAGLTKRIDWVRHNCGLDMYSSVSGRAIDRNMDYLRAIYNDQNGDDDEIPADAVIVGVPGKCKMISCEGQAGVFFCVNKDSGEQKVQAASDLAQQLEETYTDCYSGSPDNSEGSSTRAYQFWGDGYNLLIQGSQDCAKYKGKITGDS